MFLLGKVCTFTLSQTAKKYLLRHKSQQTPSHVVCKSIKMNVFFFFFSPLADIYPLFGMDLMDSILM